MIKLPADEFPAWSRYIYQLCGIYLDSSKIYLIETRFAAILTETGCRSYQELFNKAKGDTSHALPRKIIDAITTNETSFFRDASPFELLQYKILPDLIDHRTQNAGNDRAPIPLRIWSAASSTGQELYSIAIVLKELIPNPERYSTRLFGTDISDRALATASLGAFNKVEIERGLPLEKLSRYFEPRDQTWRVKDELRAMTSFKKFNLMDDPKPFGKFDIILCRNVAIYFTEADRTKLFARLASALEPDGYLIIGSTESLANISDLFEPRRYLRSVYYQLKGAIAHGPAARASNTVTANSTIAGGKSPTAKPAGSLVMFTTQTPRNSAPTNSPPASAPPAATRPAPPVVEAPPPAPRPAPAPPAPPSPPPASVAPRTAAPAPPAPPIAPRPAAPAIPRPAGSQPLPAARPLGPGSLPGGGSKSAIPRLPGARPALAPLGGR